MNDFDDKLKRALENGKSIEFEREETLREMVMQTFKSRMRWVVILLWLEGVAVFGVAIWSGIRLYHAQDLKPLIVYSTILIISVCFFVLVKVVGWQWMNKYSVLREIKRLELQVAALKEDR